MLPNGKQRLFFSCFTVSSTSCQTGFTCFSTLSVWLLKIYSCFPTLSIGFIKSLQIIIFSTKKAPHSFSAVQCILAICRMIWYSILAASVGSKALHTTAGGSALASERRWESCLLLLRSICLGLRSRCGSQKVKDEPPPWPVTVRFRTITQKGWPLVAVPFLFVV